MNLKDGASLHGMQWQMFVAAIKADPIFEAAGAELVITSGCDGQHMPTSLHYKGLALDFRTRDLTPALVKKVAADLRVALGVDYDVVIEATHLHVEFDQKVHTGDPQ